MGERTSDKLRTIALVGHGGSGKTTLAEALLFKAGATTRPGSVDDSTSILDYEEESRSRKISVDSSCATLSWKGTEVTLLDCPGYSDFIGNVYAALSAVESVLVAVNAAAGVEATTRKVWELAGERGLPRVLVLTRLDAENVRLDELLASLREIFGPAVTPVTLPDRAGPDLAGIVDLLHGDRDTPAGKSLVEKIVEVDDALMERYLGEEKISEEEIGKALRRGVREGKLIPVLSTCAAKGLGIAEALDFLVAALPSPFESAPRAARPSDHGEVKPRRPDPAEPFSAQVFKLVTDQYVGKVIYFKVASGTLRADAHVYHPRSRKNIKIPQILRPFGKDPQTIPAAIPGDICIVTKIEELEISDTIADAKAPIEFPAIHFPEPMVSLAANARNRGDEAKLSTSLKRIQSEDPTFRTVMDPQTKELVIRGMSNLHLDVILHKLKRREVQVDTRPPKIPYLETVTAKAEGKYKHRKQAGGHGQYGEVHLRLEPLARGAGFEFVDEVVGGSIPKQYIPGCEKGAREAMDRGIVAGHPVVDVRCAVFYGSYHDVDSSEMAFKIAASRAFQVAANEARPVLLEPIMNLEVTIPPDCSGSIMGDLNSRRGRIQGMESLPGLQIIKAEAPLSEITTYATDLRSVTGGRGDYKISFARYDVVPFKVQETLAAKFKAERQKEAE